MPRKSQDVTEAELAILEILWERGEATVRHVADALYGSGSDSGVATVQKLLGRLEKKSAVQRNRDVWPHLYLPAIAREDLIGRRLQSTADELCSGEISPLLTHLVRSRSLSRDDRDQLRELLNELDEQNGAPGASEG